ncbi:MAG TPA: hypothetical protein VFV81_04120 [Verrucomicrobiae bacterium]|nr:hypothetical protein [Verrucomicrobiae bacterium]
MNRKPDHNPLLGDVFAEGTEFRDAMLGETLRQVRRHRRARQIRMVAGVMVALALLAALVRPTRPPQKPVAVASKPAVKTLAKTYTLVTTVPLASTAMVTTRPFANTDIGAAGSVQIVETVPGNYRTIGDEELLALVADHPAMLVRTGTHSEELIFANPQDAKRFVPN